MLDRDTETKNVEGRLIDYIYNLTFEDLPQETVNTCKLLIMDSLGVTFPGSRAPGCDAVCGLVKSWRADAGSHLLVHGIKAPPPLAALANSTMMHALDFDDTLDASALHTFVNVLPAALAASEDSEKVNGKQLITALVAGVDIICRLSFAIQRPLSWIRTATCGSFGAAAAAVKLLSRKREDIANALGIVYSQSAGNAQGLLEGRLVKRMQPGFAASAGVTSAFLARAGITGSQEFLQGKFGFYNLYEGGEYDPSAIVDGLGSHFAIMDLSVKPYPCCRMTHSAIDAALSLRPVIDGETDHIAAIEVTASKMVAEMVGKPFVVGANPQVDAQFSIPYTVSAALCRGDVFLNDFTPPAIADPQTRSLAEKVTVVHDTSLEDKDILHAGIRVRMKDDQVHEKSVSAPLGNPDNPMDMQQCRRKFDKCIGFSGIEFDAGRIAELLSMIEDLDHAEDVSQLTSLTGV